MGRNAGYSMVASMSQTVANRYLQSLFASAVPPQPIPLPPAIQIGAVTVALSGSVSIAAPEVVFAPNPANAVSVSLAAIGTVALSAPGLPAQTLQVILYTSLSLPLAPSISLSNLYAGIDFTHANVASVGLEVLTVTPAGAPQTVYQQALTSGPAINALNAGLHAFRPSLLPIGPLNVPTAYTMSQPRSAPPGSSEFPPFPPWFTINLSPTNIAAVVLDGAISVGVDLNGWTQGNAGQLVDLNTAIAPGCYVQTLYQDGTQSWDTAGGGNRGTDFAILIDGPTLSRAIAEQVSAPITGTLVDEHVEVRGLSVSTGTFDGGLDGPGEGAAATLNLRYDTFTQRLNDGWGYFGPSPGTPVADVSITVHLQAYITVRDGDTSWVSGSRDHWRFQVADTELGLPDWLEPVLLFGAAVLPAAVVPVYAIFGWITALVVDAELQSELQAAQGLLTAGANTALNAMARPAQQLAPFPGTTAPQWLTIISDLSLTEDGIDAALKFAPSQWPALTATGPSDVFDPRPFVVTVTLADGAYRADDPSIWTDWTVVRTDTGATVPELSGTRQWAADGGTASLTIDRTTPDLYPVDGFLVTCRFYRRLGYRVDEILSDQVGLGVGDVFDRHHPYVHWSHTVHFADPQNPKFPSWSRNRSSVIHRTEVKVRCLEMRRRFLFAETATLGFYQYLDTLPGDIDTLRAEKQICPYCFFGGPTRTTLLP